MTAITAAPIASATRPGKGLDRTLWTLQIVLGLFFILASGAPKLVGQVDAAQSFAEIGFGTWFMYFTGVVEVAGGVGLMVRRLSGLAAAGLSITTVLAAATQAFLLDAPGLSIFPLVLAVIFGWMAYQRRDTIAALSARARR